MSEMRSEKTRSKSFFQSEFHEDSEKKCFFDQYGSKKMTINILSNM